MLYEQSPEEIRNASQKELVKRLYKITGMSDSGGLQITMRHQQEARDAGTLKSEYGNPTTGLFKAEQNLYPRRMLLYTQIKALVQGQDFELIDTGKIVFT